MQGKTLSSKYFTIANFLTTSRIILALFIPYLAANNLYNHIVVFFLIATFSDLLDGAVARSLKCESKLGRHLDPLADKIFIFCLYSTMLIQAPFLENDFFWFIMCITVIAKDVFILLGFFILYFSSAKFKAYPLFISKINMCLTMLAPLYWIFIKSTTLSKKAKDCMSCSDIYYLIIFITIAMNVITLCSYFSVFWKNIMKIGEE